MVWNYGLLSSDELLSVIDREICHERESDRVQKSRSYWKMTVVSFIVRARWIGLKAICNGYIDYFFIWCQDAWILELLEGFSFWWGQGIGGKHLGDVFLAIGPHVNPELIRDPFEKCMTRSAQELQILFSLRTIRAKICLSGLIAWVAVCVLIDLSHLVL